MKKYLLLIVAFIAFACTSCTNKEDIDISYKTQVTVSVKDIMDPFTEWFSGDFDINDGWSIRIQSFIYNEDGDKVESYISSVKDYDDVIKYSVDLLAGNYRIVSIADFIVGRHDDIEMEYWLVTDSENINTLTVNRGDYIRLWSDETLGINVSDIVIEDKANDINISIEPVTALIQIEFDYSDIVEGDGTGISIYAISCSDLRICSNTQNDIISNFNYPYLEYSSSAAQNAYYNIAVANPMESVNNGYSGYRMYRALLPQENITFFWIMTMDWLDGTTDEYVSEETEPMDIEGGKQYKLTLPIDELYLYASEAKLSLDKGNNASHIPAESISPILNQLPQQKSYKVLDIVKKNQKNENKIMTEK